MSAARCLVAALLVGCGSSAEAPRPTVEPAPSGTLTPPGPTAAAPARSMRTVGLFGGTSMDNLILDPTFDDGGPGIGRWIAAVDGKSFDFGQAVDAQTPKGASLPYGVFENAKAFTLLAQVSGGAGPFVTRLWVSTEAGGGDAVMPAVKVSLANAATTGLVSTDIPADPTATRVIGARTWTLFTGETKGPFALGGFLIVRIKATKQRWWLQAPEVLPSALLGGTTTKSFRAATTRAIESDERAAIELYTHQPLVYAPRKR